MRADRGPGDRCHRPRHTADPARRNTHDQGEVGDIPGDHRTGGHHRPAPDPDRRHTHRPGTQRCPLGDLHPDRFPVAAPLEPARRVHRARVVVVGEHGGRADEDTVAELGGLVHQRIVLQLDVVPDAYTGTDIGAAPYDAVLAEAGLLTDLRKLPHGGSVADLRGGVDLGGGLDSVVHTEAFRGWGTGRFSW